MTSTIMNPIHKQTLTTGAELVSFGNLVILNLEDWSPSNAITIPSEYRPTAKAIGGGHRTNNGVYVSICRFEIDTTGVLSGYVAGAYNTGNGWSNAINTDKLTGVVIWTK